MTKTLKTFDVVGFSSFEGVRKIRFANDVEGREARLKACGCDAIQLFEMPEAVTKVDAVRWMLTEAELSDGDRVLAQEWRDKATRVPGPRGRPRKVVVEAEAVEAEAVVVGPHCDLDNLTAEEKAERKRIRDRDRKRAQRAKAKAEQAA